MPPFTKIIALGASTGGIEAIMAILRKLPAEAPPVLIALHMPAALGQSLADRLNLYSAMQVCLVEDAMPLQAGQVYLAPATAHLRLEVDEERYYCRLDPSAPINRYRPSVDALFYSVAEQAGPHAIGVLLSGMDKDGARGMLAMKQAGAVTVVQDEASSVVWGMPAEAVGLGCVDFIVSIESMADQLVALSRHSDERPC